MGSPLLRIVGSAEVKPSIRDKITMPFKNEIRSNKLLERCNPDS